MNYWGLLFIFLAIMLAVGPIMLMQPSARSRHLEKLRAEAAANGLQVRMGKYTRQNKSLSVAVYRKAAETEYKTAILLRHDLIHAIHFHNQWDWTEGTAEGLSSQQQSELKSLLESFSDDVVGIEYGENYIGIWWLEKNSKQWGVQQLMVTLDQLIGILNSAQSHKIDT